ncbi:hypothetical protein TWF506_005236 [Arthrobotrys conoides]|uniref:Uncharacterized protein n=1 Tax=Arthrobotrys conoides TaxID=74498 RepID=A0AAN8NDU6_9PEZI
MRIFGLKSILAGACLLLQTKAPLAVLAEPVEISIKELDAFIQTNAASILHFQETMREVFFLWDENRVRGDQPDIPLMLDTLRESLDQKVREINVIVKKNPATAPQILNDLGFASHTVPAKNDFDWDDEPINRVLYPILKLLKEASSARATFWGFFTWANSRIGLLHWFYLVPDQTTDSEWVAPKLFGGSIYKHRGLFIYDKDKRERDTRQLNTYLLLLDTMVHYMQNLSIQTFRMSSPLGLAAEVKKLIDDIIDIISGFRGGVRRARDAYVAIPPLPGNEDPNVEDDTDENVGVSKIPQTLQRKVVETPEYVEGTEILNIPEFQFEVPDEYSESEYSPLRSLPAYVETDFDLLSAPDCSIEEQMAYIRDPQGQLRCNVF